MARCKGPDCGKRIVWAITEDEKRQPVDPDPHPRGVLILVDGEHEGRPAVRSRVESLFDEPGDRWMPHHATCVNVDRWRVMQGPRPGSELGDKAGTA